ncbi:hypothetical protein [Streptomyces sp. NPDC059649]|uniref:hypothetical protein n=1 Tax=Streptomyces sp. NPDC059649 TaxID=3346895 RepID=UPI0036BE0349
MAETNDSEKQMPQTQTPEASDRRAAEPGAWGTAEAGAGDSDPGLDELAAGPTRCPSSIQQALAAHTTMTLAYVDESGPQACAVLYATDATDASDSTDTAEATDVGQVAVEEGVEAEVAAAAGAGGGPARYPVLYFVTSTTTRHGRALAGTDARVAFTAQRDGQEWSGLTGIQGRGRCRPLSGAERAVGWRAYTRRFPFVEADERLRAALERTTLWELRPDWLRLIDNGQGFGHKEEWRRPEGA